MLARRMEDRRQTVGLLAATIVNSAPFRSKEQEPVSPLDFFPDHRTRETTGRREWQQTSDDHERILTAIFQRPPEKAA